MRLPWCKLRPLFVSILVLTLLMLFGGLPLFLAESAMGSSHSSSSATLTQLGDFSIALSGVLRKEQKTILRFVVTKVRDTDHGSQHLDLTLTDDHGNIYQSRLGIYFGFPEEWGVLSLLNDLPIGFTYIEEVEFQIPKVAPIETIQFGKENELAFSEIKFKKPEFLKDFGNLTVRKGQLVKIGNWLSFTIQQAFPGRRRHWHKWTLPLLIKNEDYNSLPIDIRTKVQYEDGTISQREGRNVTEIPGQSEKVVGVDIPMDLKDVPNPKAILIRFHTKRDQKPILKIYSIASGKFLPYPVPNEIYTKWSGKHSDRPGFSLGLPVTKAYKEGSGAEGSEVTGLIQKFERGTIYYHSTGPFASQAFEISNPARKILQRPDEVYEGLGGVTSWLGFPIKDMRIPRTLPLGERFMEFEKGAIKVNVRWPPDVFSYTRTVEDAIWEWEVAPYVPSQGFHDLEFEYLLRIPLLMEQASRRKPL